MLYIYNVDYGDQGSYSCKAINIHGEVISAPVMVTVIGIFLLCIIYDPPKGVTREQGE